MYIPNNANTLLVYILPDSLELPVGLKGNVPHTMATIKSHSLRATLDSIKPVSLGKAFPNWNDADSISITQDGIKIKKPEFGRIFVFTFHNEKEADAIISVLKKQSSVLFVEKNIKAKLFQDPDYDNGAQWHLRNDGRNGGIIGADIHAEGAWGIFTGNPNITIGIFDTGVDIDHPELDGRAAGDLPDGNGHGTHVAGLAAAGAHNNEGGRGVDWNAQIFSQRIFNSGVYIGDAGVANRITTAVDNGVQVLNNSWGGPMYSTTLGMAFAYAYRMNRTSVAAMGNDWGNVISYPAAFNNVIAVGATTNRDEHSAFSNTGNHISVSAPGGENLDIFDPRNIFSTWLNNDYQFDAGTSMSTPQVSGLASLLRGFNTNLANDDVRNIIELSADDVNAAIHLGWDNELGFGRINAEGALTFLRDNTLSHWSATGGTVFNTSSPYVMQILGAPGLASGNYTVYRVEVRTNVIFPTLMCIMIGAWGRGVGSTGWNMGNPNYGEGFCQVVPGTLTNNGATLRTYVYDVYNMLGQHLGYYPTSPQNVTFQYTVLGVPLPTVIGGDNAICAGTSNDYSIPGLPMGATVSWSVTPQGIVTINSPNSAQTTLSVIASGVVTLSATITTACASPITITKSNITVGAPDWSTLSTAYYTQGYNGGRLHDMNCLSTYFNPPGYMGDISVTDRVASSYTWTFINRYPSNATVAISYSDPRNATVSARLYGDRVTYRLTTSNACGSYSYDYTFTTTQPCNVDFESKTMKYPASNLLAEINQSTDLLIAPNPNTGSFVVSLKNGGTIKQIVVRNSVGSTIKNYRVNNSNSEMINIENQPAAVYMVEVYDGNRWLRSKIMKQ